MRIRAIGTAILALLLTAGNATAQEDGYLMEVGPLAGGCFYMGDANPGRLYLNTGGLVGAVLRYNVNTRLSLKADLAMGKISGSTDNIKDRSFPQPASFKRNVFDFGVQVEGGFLAYGTTTWNNCHRLVPYYLLGIGLTYAPKPADNVFAANFPIGFGVRYKLAERLNLGLEWTMRFSTSDCLDVTGNGNLADPFKIQGGFMKNKDSYCYTMLTLTYDIFARPCDCNDDK